MYIDSDAFFQDTIVELMSKHDHLMCVPDRATYLNKAKDSLTYQIAHNPDSSSRYWFNTFNAGIMFLDKTLVNRKVFDELLLLIDPENYKTLTRPTTDQYLLNQYFRESYHRLSSSYNYRLGIADIVEEKEGVNLENAKIIHFTGQKKPWMANQAIQATQRFKLYLKAFNKWNAEYIDYLTQIQKKTFAK
jgi:lipopolysaccharide biosynthesis glycosyltransferase